MTTKSNLTFKVLNVLAWVVFIGLCIEAGGIVFNTIFKLFFNPIGSKTIFWDDINLVSLYDFDRANFITQTTLISIVAILKAILFYAIVHLLQNKKIELSQPFNLKVKNFILNASYLAFGIAFFSNWGAKYSQWFVTKGIVMPKIETMRLDGALVWLFMGVILFVIAKVFDKGIELQTENDLTV